MEEQLAYRLAQTQFELTAEPGEEWNERRDYKVPSMLYLAMARTAIEFLEEYYATDED